MSSHAAHAACLVILCVTRLRAGAGLSASLSSRSSAQQAWAQIWASAQTRSKFECNFQRGIKFEHNFQRGVWLTRLKHLRARQIIFCVAIAENMPAGQVWVIFPDAADEEDECKGRSFGRRPKAKWAWLSCALLRCCTSDTMEITLRTFDFDSGLEGANNTGCLALIQVQGIELAGRRCGATIWISRKRQCRDLTTFHLDGWSVIKFRSG